MQGAVNIASGRPLVLKNLINALAKLTGRTELLRFGALRVEPDDQELLLANTRRLNVEVGFSPHYSLEEGLKETVNFWRTRLK